MGIIVDSETRVIVQGITGKQGSYHAKLMLEYGTNVVAGVVPGKGGTVIHGVSVFDTVKDAAEAYSLDASIVFVPAPFALDAALEAIVNEIKTVVLITEHIPVRDTITLMAHAAQAHATVIGPNTPGIITPGECKIGIMPSDIFTSGNVGLISRSGTLTYEIAAALTAKGDPVTGLNFIDALELLKADPKTAAVVLVGEIGGNLEELTAQYIAKEKYPKPVVAFVAGRFAPPGKRMGHAGAVIMGKMGTAQSKIDAFLDAGVKVAEKPNDITRLLNSVLA